MATTATLPTTQPDAPDAGFAELFAAALGYLRDPDSTWTDHNTHDPGITLLEAALWALADLHYRVESHDFDAWSSVASVPSSGARLPVGEVDRAVVSHVLSTYESQARAAIAPARDRAEAIGALCEAFGTTAHTDQLRSAMLGVLEPGRDAGVIAALPAPVFQPDAAAAVARLLRDPQVLSIALDRSDQIEEAVAADADAGTTNALEAALADSGLWPEEIADLREQAAARLLVARLRALTPEILELVDATDSVAEALGALGSVLGLAPSEADLALRAAPCAPAPPEWWETTTGRTLAWPPQPVQARSVEPVLDDDYLRLVLGVEGVKRAWVVQGLARGLRWNGDVNRVALPYRQAAFTLLVEPQDAGLMLSTPDAPLGRRRERLLRFLDRCLRESLTLEGESAEVDRPFEDPGRVLGPLSPRRLIGDELVAAVLSTCPVVVGATLHIEAGIDGRRVIARAEALLRGFLSSERSASFETHATEAQPPCTERLDGPWPWRARPVPGWTPGSPVRVSEVLQVLLDVRGVVSASDVRVQSGESADANGVWERSSLAIDPFCVPRYADHCFVLRPSGGTDD